MQKKKRRPAREGLFLSSHRSDPQSPYRGDPRTWPVARAYVPQDDAWRASGFGTAGVVRQRPDGRFASALFTISMIDGGVSMMYGKPDTTLEEVDELLAAIATSAPPCELGPADLAARYVWGAMEYSRAADESAWPREATALYLALVPLLSGTRNWWLQQFIGENGLVPHGLLEFLDENPPPAHMPESKEMAVATIMRLECAEPETLLAAIRARPEDFHDITYQPDAPPTGGTAQAPDGPVTMFHWMRERRVDPGRKVPHGVVGFTGGGGIVAHAGTLSLASLLVTLLRDISAGTVRLIDTAWASPSGLNDLLIPTPGREIVRRGG